MKRAFKMLLAEDNQDDALLFAHGVQKTAEETGLRVQLDTVCDGAEAIEYLSGEGAFADRAGHSLPDILVLDLKMPRLSGLDVLKWLNSHSEYKRIPRILLTGSGLDCDIEEAYQLGVNTYFQKPVSLDELRELIHYIVCYWSHTRLPVIWRVIGRPINGQVRQSTSADPKLNLTTPQANPQIKAEHAALAG